MSRTEANQETAIKAFSFRAREQEDQCVSDMETGIKVSYSECVFSEDPHTHTHQKVKLNKEVFPSAIRPSPKPPNVINIWTFQQNQPVQTHYVLTGFILR